MNDGPHSRVIPRSVAVTMLCIALLTDLSLLAQTSVRATRSTFAHPVLERWNLATIPTEASRKRTEGLAQEIMELSEEQLQAIIPEQTPRIHSQCPVCARKAKDDSLPEQPRPFPGIFDPLHPDRVACKNCRTEFPYAEFPQDKKEEFHNLLGESIVLSYWEDVDGPRTSFEKKTNRTHRFYVRGVIDTARKLWLLPRLTAVAELYRQTHDERYARRLIFVLDEFARRYPHYVLTTDYGHAYVSTRGRKPPYGFIDTRWGRRSGDDLPADLLELFDLAAASPSLDEDTKQRILTALFREPQQRLDQWSDGNPDIFFGNECPIKEMVERALVLEDPARVHICYRLLCDVPRYAATCDGLFRESLGYGSLFRLTFFKGARLLDGYSDPPGYVGSDGLHLENIRPLQELEEFYQRLCTVPDELRLPSGGWLSYDDSGPGFGPTWWSGDGESCRPLSRSSNVLLPGVRRAVLGAGTGDRQVQVALDFAEHGVNHGHQSGLAMQLFAFGHYLIDDFPYHKSALRRYAEMTVGHPTVVIDHQNQQSRSTGGDVEFYAPGMEGVAAIRVDDTRAYDGLATRYARTLILNSIAADRPYVVDVFETAGGTLHDYHLRSSSQHPSQASASLTLQPLIGLRPLLPPSETWTEPRFQRDNVGSGYGLLFDVRRADVNGPFHFTSTCKEPWAKPTESKDTKDRTIGAYLATPDSWPDRPAVGIRHHVAVGRGYEFLAAASPSLTESGFHGREGKPADQWPMIPHHILRHRVQSGEASVFVVVHEPYHDQPTIRSVTRLETSDENVLALRIELPGRFDQVIYALDRPREMTAAGVSLSGRLAVVSQPAGQAPRAYLIEGTQLKADAIDVSCNTAAYSGSINAMERRWNGRGVHRLRIVANPPLPEGYALRGKWMQVRLGPWTEENDRRTGTARSFAGSVQAIEIDRVVVEGDGTWVYATSDHGLMMRDDAVEEFYWPRRTFAGRPSFVVPSVVTTHPLPLSPRSEPIAIAPATLVPEGLRPGFKRILFNGAGRDTTALTRVSEDRVENVNGAAIAAIALPGAVRLEGYLRVESDGVYTIHFGAADEYRLTLENVPVLESFRGRSNMPVTQQVRLSAGVYAAGIDCFRHVRHMPAWFTADWEGPNLSRRSFNSSLSAP